MDASNCFTLFPALPTELRWKIWDYALSAHFIVDFVPKLDAGDFPVAAGELHPVRPVLSMDNSRISQACKEAWRIIRGPYRKIELAGGAAQSSNYYADWVDFSRTTFYLNHGEFSFYCIESLTPEPISGHVKSVAMAWFTYRDLVMTSRRLTVFPALQRLVLLIPLHQKPHTPPPFRDAMTALDLYLQGKIPKVEDRDLLASHTREELEKSLQYDYSELGRKCPTVEAVLVPGPL
ncbi:hypothetical protein V502_06587 [Pseudogymnoascus sp. VKM F-4520 (FW-2644)]|nr:hypothetical protein V502_06587 [Pseudogymnoascus sp. VKM F-4520 (FW-2644)]